MRTRAAVLHELHAPWSVEEIELDPPKAGEVLVQLKASGMTILVSTPYMDEANRCDRIALIQRGRLLGIDTPQQIASSFDRPLFAVRTDKRYQALLALRGWSHTHSIYPFGETLHYSDTRTDLGPDQIAAELRAFLTSGGFADAVVQPVAPTVEDTFIARMGAPDEEQVA